MEISGYRPRICDEILQSKLRRSGAVLITGPKWCGKTWTGLKASNSVIYLQDPDKRSSYLKMAQTLPSYLLRGEKPRLIDEWQTAPILWDAVRFEVDKSHLKGQFILTGSVVVPDNDELAEEERRYHSGTGRISKLKMRPMSLYESGESSGEISLKQLFDGNISDINTQGKLTIEEYAYAICRGGWPESLYMDSSEDALQIARDYIESVCDFELRELTGERRNPERMRAILKSLSRNISTLTTDTTIMEDVRANDVSITNKTLSGYLKWLENLYLIEDIKAWQPSLRSKTGIRTSDKRQFVDPSLAAAILHVSPESLLDDFNYYGFLFESLCARDLRVYSEPLSGTIKHFRDNSGLEVDMIITLADGRWAAVEIKLGSREIEKGAQNLISLSGKIDETKGPKPSFLMILTGGEFAYKRDDGVLVVPLSCLKN